MASSATLVDLPEAGRLTPALVHCLWYLGTCDPRCGSAHN